MNNFTQNLNEPPIFGELSFSFDFEPVSLQSNSQKKEFVKNEIRKITNQIKYVLSGEIKVEIQWLVHEQERYESPNAPDMDNIIKPILDGLSGPNGIIIDDCQVQTIGSHWIDWIKKEHKININIQFVADEFVSKNNLVFVRIDRNLYMPIQSDLPIEAKKILIEYLQKVVDLKNEIYDKTNDYYEAKRIMPIQRLFHKSRINENFTLLEVEEYLK
ncbi:RusA family crossover junction endodeoxyribonuclease [Empedobacter falsenii]